MTPTNLNTEQHQKIAAQTDDFLTNGGKIEVIPFGVSGETEWLPIHAKEAIKRQKRADMLASGLDPAGSPLFSR